MDGYFPKSLFAAVVAFKDKPASIGRIVTVLCGGNANLNETEAFAMKVIEMEIDERAARRAKNAERKRNSRKGRAK